MMRHALGVLGVLAAGVLLAVSAAMNWRFGFSLGKTEFDGQIYGAASAAADCFKALIPFFLFAAIRNRMWSQAAAAAVVWVVVTAYSLTSALGHAALNRLDTAGQRAQQAAVYKDLRSELKRTEDQLGWIPQHRPALAVQADIDAIKNERPWVWTKACATVTGKQGRDFCQHYHALTAELASAEQAGKLGAKAAQLRTQISASPEHAAMSEADPQAAMLAKIGALVFANLKVDDVQMALTIFIALLLEIGSAFGMYVSFSYWRIHDQVQPVAPSMASLRTADQPEMKDVTPVAPVAAPVTAPAAIEEAAPAVPAIAAKVHEEEVAPAVAAEAESAPAPVAAPVVAPAAIAAPAILPAVATATANDNKSLPVQRLVAPENDVERFHKERIESEEGSSLTATTLYEDYCAWCEEQEKEPLALPTFGREFGELKTVKKAKIAGRVRYIGLKLKDDKGRAEDKKPPVPDTKAA